MKYRIKDPEVRKALKVLGYPTDFEKDSPYLRSVKYEYWFSPDSKGQPRRACIGVYMPLGLLKEEVEPIEEEELYQPDEKVKRTYKIAKL